jgi:hypothetical protein
MRRASMEDEDAYEGGRWTDRVETLQGLEAAGAGGRLGASPDATDERKTATAGDTSSKS